MSFLHNPRNQVISGFPAHHTPLSERVSATRVLRKMRGGSQAHLLAANDGKAYVTKLTNNPQRLRSVLGEALCHLLLSNMAVSIPAARPILITNEFLAQYPGFGIEDQNGLRAAEPGFHFGSQYPGEFERDAVYDHLPSTLFDNLENRVDFAAILVFDVWVMQADRRQAVFVRERLTPGRGSVRKRSLRAFMVDHGMAFGGIKWDFIVGPSSHTLHCPAAYRAIYEPGAFEACLTAVEEFPEATVWESIRRIPDCWVRDATSDLEAVAERLLERRKLVRNEVFRLVRRSVEHFPGWRTTKAGTWSANKETSTSRLLKNPQDKSPRKCSGRLSL